MADAKYVILLSEFCQINYTPLDGSIRDLNIAINLICEEAAHYIEYKIRLFHSATIWKFVKTLYKSVNPDVLNANQIDQDLSDRPTTIGVFPLNDN